MEDLEHAGIQPGYFLGPGANQSPSPHAHTHTCTHARTCMHAHALGCCKVKRDNARKELYARLVKSRCRRLIIILRDCICLLVTCLGLSRKSLIIKPEKLENLKQTLLKRKGMGSDTY